MEFLWIGLGIIIGVVGLGFAVMYSFAKGMRF